MVYTSVPTDGGEGYPNAKNENYYGPMTKNSTKIKYPAFMAERTCYNHISIGDAFDLCRHLTDDNNPYGFTSRVDSHLPKNSEWGAVVYLACSKYGASRTDFAENNSTFTGRWDSQDKWGETINFGTSTNSNISGIYDLVGGMNEMVAGYLQPNESEASKNFGGRLISLNTEERYKSEYARGNEEIHQSNFLNEQNMRRLGEALWEVHDTVTNKQWNQDLCSFPSGSSFYMCRGGDSGGNHSDTGVFGVYLYTGFPYFNRGFRAVLVCE